MDLNIEFLLFCGTIIGLMILFSVLSALQKPTENSQKDENNDRNNEYDKIENKNDEDDALLQKNLVTSEFKKPLDIHNSFAPKTISPEHTPQVEETQVKELKEEIKLVNFPQYEYKFVAIDDISSYNFVKKIRNISNNNAFYGWDYYKLETCIIPPPVSFAAAVSGEPLVYEQHQYIVFRRPFVKKEEN